LSTVRGAEQRIAAFGPPDFSTWVEPLREEAFPAIAQGNAPPAEAIAPPTTVEQQTPPRAETASPATSSENRAEEKSAPGASLATGETPKGVAAEASSTKEAAPPQQPTPNGALGTTLANTREPAPEQSTSTPSALSAEAPEPAPTAPKPAAPLTEPRLSAPDIAALIARGDALVGVRDIASARLFYQRAAEAGDGGAALRMAATFDPIFLNRANIRGVSDNKHEALSWYQRARDLGEGKAERKLKELQEQ
jgi:hypothetical protein